MTKPNVFFMTTTGDIKIDCDIANLQDAISISILGECGGSVVIVYVCIFVEVPRILSVMIIHVSYHSYWREFKV